MGSNTVPLKRCLTLEMVMVTRCLTEISGIRMVTIFPPAENVMAAIVTIAPIGQMVIARAETVMGMVG